MVSLLAVSLTATVVQQLALRAVAMLQASRTIHFVMREGGKSGEFHFVV